MSCWAIGGKEKSFFLINYYISKIMHTGFVVFYYGQIRQQQNK